MTAPELDRVLDALERQSSALADYSLDVFLEYDFNDHSILDGALTGGHVVTYLAREADRMADELLRATEQAVPPPDRSRRWELSENGNLRPGAVMVDDIQVSTQRLREAVESVSDWSTLDATIREIPERRLLQLVVHLVDLGRPWDALPDRDAAVAAAVLPRLLADELSAHHLKADDSAVPLEWSATADAIEVRGSSRSLLAWATGRTDGVADLPTDLTPPTRRVWI